MRTDALDGQQAFAQVRGRLRFVVDLTCHNTNHFVFVEGPEITIRSVAKRQVKAGEPQ